MLLEDAARTLPLDHQIFVERRGSAVSVVTTVAYLGFLLGPAAVGVAADATTLRAALAGVAGVALLLAALARSTPGAN